jgi:ubiquinone/menaquinone biosynthesis C-methylase UbiE
MEPALQRRVQRYGWDKASPYYEAFWQEQLKPAQDLLLQLADLQPGSAVLDIACGTGLVSFKALSCVGATGSVTGTDISDKMIEIASAIADHRGQKNISFARMDAEELSLENETFDTVLCALGLMYVPDPGRALREMHRVLKPGGKTVAAVWGKRNNCGWADIFEIVDQHVASEVCPMFFNLGNTNMLELHLREAGFDNIVAERINTLLIYRNEEEALGAAFDGGPVALAYHKFSDAVKREVHEAYLTSILPYKNGGGYEVPGEFVVAKGIRQ